MWLGSLFSSDFNALAFRNYDNEWAQTSQQLASGNVDGARTQIKKSHEREAVIADLQDKEYLKREEEAEKPGVKTEYGDLQGYPVASLDAPDFRLETNTP